MSRFVVTHVSLSYYLPKLAATNNALNTDGLTRPTWNRARAGSLKIFKQIPMFTCIRAAYVWFLPQPKDRVEIVNNVTHSLPSAAYHFQRLLLMVYRPVCCSLLLQSLIFLTLCVGFCYWEVLRLLYAFRVPIHSSEFRRVFFLRYLLPEFYLEDPYYMISRLILLNNLSTTSEPRAPYSSRVCVLWPVTTFVNYAHSIGITQ